MDPKNYPAWLKKKIEENTLNLSNEEFEGYFPEIIDNSYYKNWIETSNPLYVWAALGYCLKINLEIPAWIKTYLSNCAKNLTTMDWKKDEDLAPKVYKALSMSSLGSGNILSNYNTWEQKHKTWIFVKYYFEAHPDGKIGEAFETIAKILNQSFETTKKWYYAQNELFKKREFPS